MGGRPSGGLATAAKAWLPVTAVVAALFLVPSSPSANAAGATLQVTPAAGTFGGQRVVFSGDMGTGQHRIRLQRRGNPSGTWADVRDPKTGKLFTRLTEADGTFTFALPAPAMNGVYFRVRSRSAASPAHKFEVEHQDVDVSLVELAPADVPLPRGFAVVDEKFRIAVDTARHDEQDNPTKPILKGRGVELQVRDGGWKHAGETASVGADGRLDFGVQNRSEVTTSPEVYRAVLQGWTGDGDRVGWFPSFPFYLEVVRRPKPVAGLALDPQGSSLMLTWSLPVDADRDKIVIARTQGAGAPEPTAAKPGQVVATLPGTATSYTDGAVLASWTYKYAVYTVSDDGVYTALEARDTIVIPKGKP